jgi:hypothetical protein
MRELVAMAQSALLPTQSTAFAFVKMGWKRWESEMSNTNIRCRARLGRRYSQGRRSARFGISIIVLLFRVVLNAQVMSLRFPGAISSILCFMGIEVHTEPQQLPSIIVCNDIWVVEHFLEDHEKKGKGKARDSFV